MYNKDLESIPFCLFTIFVFFIFIAYSYFTFFQQKCRKFKKCEKCKNVKDEKRRKHKKCKTKCDKKYYRRAYITVLTELTETEKRRTITETNSAYTLD